MSTRATIRFETRYGKPEAIVYRHSDGYPDGLGQDLLKFFDDVARATKDTRFTDPSYLAAKWIVWDVLRYKTSLAKIGHGNAENVLEFLGVGVIMTDPGDIEYRYHVLCNGGVPQVRIEEV